MNLAIAIKSQRGLAALTDLKVVRPLRRGDATHGRYERAPRVSKSEREWGMARTQEIAHANHMSVDALLTREKIGVSRKVQLLRFRLRCQLIGEMMDRGWRPIDMHELWQPYSQYEIIRQMIARVEQDRARR